MTPEGRAKLRLAGKKRWAGTTPEERSALMKAYLKNISPEAKERRARAARRTLKKTQANRTLEQKREAALKATIKGYFHGSVELYETTKLLKALTKKVNSNVHENHQRSSQ
jgi:hypothetical protein